MSTNSNSMSYLLDEVVSAVAFESFFGGEFMMPLLYDVRASARRRERTASFSGLSDYAEKTNGQAAAADEVANEFEKDFVHASYGKRVPVERELIDDQEYGLVQDLGDQLGFKARETMEKKAAGVFHDAFDGATYLGEDGLSLCNDAHLNAAGGNSQDNKGTSALDMSAVKSTRTAMRKFKNYSGDPLGVRPNGLLIPPDIEEDAWEIANSTGRPDTANRADNFYNGRFMLFVWDYLTDVVSGGDANNWFMVATDLMRRHLIWWQRIALEIYGHGNLDTGTRVIGGYFRAAHGFRGWQWCYGHEVA